MDRMMDVHTATALLAWQIEMGADEPIGDQPVNRYEVPQAAPRPAAAAAPAPDVAPAAPDPVAIDPVAPDPVAEARARAAGAADLGALKAALATYDYCDLKKGARNLVFADGDPKARVMLIGEAPGRDEDIEGRPFVGRAGQLLDRMLAAIGMGRDSPTAPVYITNILPWRPPQNRDPSPDEIAMLLPFVERHITLVDPALIVLMGNTPCAALLGRRGITGMRGKWQTVLNRPAMPMFHPAYLLRTPHAKREAWADLLAIQARLREV
jgi:DNA polymerase